MQQQDRQGTGSVLHATALQSDADGVQPCLEQGWCWPSALPLKPKPPMHGGWQPAPQGCNVRCCPAGRGDTGASGLRTGEATPSRDQEPKWEAPAASSPAQEQQQQQQQQHLGDGRAEQGTSAEAELDSRCGIDHWKQLACNSRGGSAEMHSVPVHG